MITPGLRVGLQEWAVCVRALREGAVCLIARKGGVHEPRGGTFTPEHERFVLLPSYLHQKADRLDARFSGAYLASTSDHPAVGKIPVTAWADVTRVWKCDVLERILALGTELAWTPEEISARFHYRSQPWLYLLALRVRVLPSVVDILDRPSYAGCRSWIDLDDAVPFEGSTAAIADDEYAKRVERIERTLNP